MKKVLFALMLLLGLPAASQAGWIYQFDVGNPNILGNPAVGSPYATLTIDSVSADTLRFSLDTAGNNALFSTFAFNLNGPSVANLTLTNISGTGPGDPSNWSLFTQNNGVPMDGFGKFDVGVGPSSSNQRLSSLVFDLKFSDPSYANINSVLRGNSGAGNPPGTFYYALEYFPSNGNTGYVGVSDPPATVATPAPPGFVMLLTGMVTLGGIHLVRRRSKVVA